jgi:hypothetical protein
LTLNPAGHLGFTAVTFLVCLPLVQMRVDFLVAATFASASCFARRSAAIFAAASASCLDFYYSAALASAALITI